ncbi:helix-turn-helix domain-containing protein [Bacillus songklensis]|uniref:helix-turn-helix domain-containing protein n=1 Tax=Bacillus songklensis TaxID=1069116 RepID=UPI00366CBD8F
MIELSNLAYNLRFYRENAGLTQGELAEHLNISRSTLSKWERNHQEPSLRDVIVLCDFFQISLDQLVGRKQKKRKQETLQEIQSTYDFIDNPLNDNAHSLLLFLKEYPKIENQLQQLSKLPSKSQKKLLPLIQALLEKAVAMEK